MSKSVNCYFVVTIAIILLLSSCQDQEKPKRTKASGSVSDGRCKIHSYKRPAYNLLSETNRILLAIKNRINEKLPVGVEVVIDPVRIKTSSYGTTHLELAFLFHGEALCSTQFYAKAHIRGDVITMQGRLPEAADLVRVAKGMPSEMPTLPSLRKALEPHLVDPPSHVTLERADPCLMLLDYGLRPGFLAYFHLDERPYEAVLVNGEAYDFTPRFLQLTGTFSAYDNNVRTGKLTTIKIEGMHEGGYLCNDYFTTTVESANKQDYAYANDLVFDYDPTDSEFMETSIFVNASLMMKWFLKLDKEAHWSIAQVELKLTKNDDQYGKGPEYRNPESDPTRTRPLILIPDALKASSGEKVLDNLTSDFAVVAHELGHHIVSRYVGFAASSDNITIHEALADFFVYAKTANPCLCESVCQEDFSSICAVGIRCLRTAENDLSASDPDYDGMLVHERSAIVSGMLWDIGKKITLAKITEIVMQSLPYLNKTTDIKNLVESLMEADKDINKGANACAIYNAAIKRGMQRFISDLDCTSFAK